MAKLKCGCMVGTRSYWRDKLGRLTQVGSLFAVSMQCASCGKVTKITTKD